MNQAHVVSWPDTAPPQVPDGNGATWFALLERMAGGDADACIALYDCSAPAAFSLIAHIVGDRTAAERILRDMYVDLMQRAARGEHRQSDAVAWVLSIARAAAVHQLCENRHPAVAAHAGDLRLNPLLVGLDDEQRTILEMIYFGGLSARETAARLGRPVPHVMGALHSALSLLRTRGACASTAASRPAGDPSRSPSRSTRSGRYQAAGRPGSSPSPAW